MQNNKLVAKIKELCDLHGVRPTVLEKELGFGAGVISRWDKADPSLSKIIAIADYFKVSLDELVGRNQKIRSSDLFDRLIQLTDDKFIKWDNKSENYEEEILKYVISAPIYECDYSELYIAQYEEASLILSAQYEFEAGEINNIETAFYIKADKDSKAVRDQDRHGPVRFWEYLHKQFYGEFDDVKADIVKRKIMNDRSKLLNENNPEYILELDLDKSEINYLLEVFSSPQYNEVFEVLNTPQYKKFKAYFDAYEAMKEKPKDD